MKVIMNNDQLGAPYGKVVEQYLKDQEYDIPEGLAKVFLDNKWARTAVIIAEVKAVIAPAPTVTPGPTANKALTSASENKEQVDTKPKRRRA